MSGLVEKLRKPTSCVIYDGDPKNAQRMRKVCEADQSIRNEAADEITRLTARVAELEGALAVERKHSQAMHRRAQIALAVHQSAVSILNNWKSLNAKRPWPEGFLFGVALNDIKRARERIEAKLEPKP